MGDWKDILSNNDEPISEEDLLRHLDKNKVAGEMLPALGDESDPFAADALEGLKQIENTEKVKKHVRQLNQKLHQQLENKKHRGEKNKISLLRWIIITLIILLFTCIMGYVLVRMNSDTTNNSQNKSLFGANATNQDSSKSGR